MTPARAQSRQIMADIQAVLAHTEPVKGVVIPKPVETDYGPIDKSIVTRAGLWDRLTGWLHQLDTDSDLDDVEGRLKYRSMASGMRTIIESLERYGAA